MKDKKKDLLIDSFKVKKIAQRYSTQLYCYSYKKIKDNSKNLKKKFSIIKQLSCFTVK